MEQPADAPESRLDSLDFVWDEAVRLVSQQLTAVRDLDAKTAALIGLGSAAFALVVAQRTELGPAVGLLVAELAAVLSFLLLALRLRRMATAPSLLLLAKRIDLPARETKFEFLPNLLEAYERNQTYLSVKELFLRWATYGMLVVLLTTVVALVWRSIA